MKRRTPKSLVRMSASQTGQVESRSRRALRKRSVVDFEDDVFNLREIDVAIGRRLVSTGDDDLPRGSCNGLPEERRVRRAIAEAVDARVNGREPIGGERSRAAEGPRRELVGAARAKLAAA